MNFSPLDLYDLPFLKAFEPPGWGDLVPRFQYFINRVFCTPLKLVDGGKMVAIGTTIMHGDSAWLASIIVHPDHRNNGYGQMITKKLVESIDRKKYSTIYLDATDLGYPVYVKIGFELEANYAHLKKEGNVTGLQLPGSVISYSKEYLKQLLRLDSDLSCENRSNTLMENLSTAMIYINNGRLEGFYLPSLGNGLILADNDVAGISLAKCRLNNNYYSILPEKNKACIAFLQEQGLIQFRFSRRMFIGKKRPWKAERIYNRISGQLG